jgi:hypothetical protein
MRHLALTDLRHRPLSHRAGNGRHESNDAHPALAVNE